MDTYRGLIQALEAEQAKSGLADGKFAARMGLSRSMWVMLRNGTTQPGRRTLERIGKALPELRLDIANALFLKPESTTTDKTYETTEKVGAA